MPSTHDGDSPAVLRPAGKRDQSNEKENASSSNPANQQVPL